MSTSQMKRSAAGTKKPKRDPRDRTEEFIQWDVTEGPFTKAFHRLFARRMATQDNSKPYPWFIGGVHRLARTLDTAVTWELVALAAAPVIFGVSLFERPLGFPPHLGGLLILFLGCYAGFFFVLLVFLDRRLDLMDKMRINMMRQAKIDRRNDRLLRRRAAAKNAAEIAQRNADALARGQARAREPDEEAVPPQAAHPQAAHPQAAHPQAAMSPALDDLLGRPTSL